MGSHRHWCQISLSQHKKCNMSFFEHKVTSVLTSREDFEVLFVFASVCLYHQFQSLSLSLCGNDVGVCVNVCDSEGDCLSVVVCVHVGE